ncbi:MAG: cell division protein FtsZ [Metamycoplasmataceae bacterium]
MFKTGQKSFLDIKIMGVGGCGNNSIKEMLATKSEFHDIDFLIANTDLQVLNDIEVDRKIILGKEGIGAGADPQKGEDAALESIEEIKQSLVGAKMLIITAGLGGGTGTGAGPIIAKVARDMGILVVALVTLPFNFEGSKRMNYANVGLEKFRKNVDSLIVISNDMLLENFSSFNIKDSFKYSNKILKQTIKAITDIILKPSIINLDFADLCNIMKNKGNAFVGFGQACGKEKSKKALEKVFNSKLIDLDLKTINNVILFINSSPDFSLLDINLIVEEIKQKTNQDINLLFGQAIDDNLRNEVQISFIATTNKSDGKNQETIFEKDLELYSSTIRNGILLQQEEFEKTIEQSFPLNIDNQDENSDDDFIIETQNQDEDDDIPFFMKSN